MNIGELKDLIQDMDDDVEVVVSGDDHSYNRTGGGSQIVQAELHHGNYLTERTPGSRESRAMRFVYVFWIDDGRY